jgi:hypothetical protein
MKHLARIQREFISRIGYGTNSFEEDADNLYMLLLKSREAYKAWDEATKRYPQYNTT